MFPFYSLVQSLVVCSLSLSDSVFSGMFTFFPVILTLNGGVSFHFYFTEFVCLTVFTVLPQIYKKPNYIY